MKANLEFLRWFHELEGTHMRSERYYSETTGNPARGYEWLKVAFEAGANMALCQKPIRPVRVAALLRAPE